jgi:HK97 gp10 family phage protein
MDQNISLIGSELVVTQLLSLPGDVKAAIERKAVKKVNELLIGVIKSETPTDSGTLKESIKATVKQYQSGRIVIGIVGPEYDYIGYVIKKKSKSFEIRRPANYAHLVEGGTVKRETEAGANRGSVSANAFMERSIEKEKDQVQRIVEDAIKKAIS